MNLRHRVLQFAFALVTLPLFLCLSSCFACEDCDGGVPPEYTERLSFTNHSKLFLQMTFESASGDTLGSPLLLDPAESRLFPYTRFQFGPEQKARILFGAASKTCLTFEGGIRDTLSDPRSRSAYTFDGTTYSYTFTDSLLNRAGTCP